MYVFRNTKQHLMYTSATTYVCTYIYPYICIGIKKFKNFLQQNEIYKQQQKNSKLRFPKKTKKTKFLQHARVSYKKQERKEKKILTDRNKTTLAKNIHRHILDML